MEEINITNISEASETNKEINRQKYKTVKIEDSKLKK